MRAALALLLSLLPAVALGQTAQEPLELLPDRVTSVRGLVPFHPDHLRDRSVLGRDLGWEGRKVPSLRAVRGPIHGGWYRIHLRSDEWNPRDIAVAVPLAHGAWTLYLNGEPIGAGGGPGQVARRPGVSRIVAVPNRLLDPQANVLALRISAVEGLEGLGGPLRVGPRDRLARMLSAESGLSLGLVVSFLLLGVFALVLAASDRERLPLLLAATLLALALYGGTVAGWFAVLAMDDTTRAHLAQALFLLMHAGSLFLFEQMFLGRADSGARALSLVAVGLAGISVALPLGDLHRLASSSWVFTAACALYIVYLGRGLAAHNPVVRAGVRGGGVGLFLAALYEAWVGTWSLPGLGPFEAAFLLLVLSIAAGFALTQARARRRAMSVLRSSRDGLAVLDLHGHVVHANPALRGLLESAGPDVERGAIEVRLEPDDRQRLSAMISHLGDVPVGAEAQSMVVPFEGPRGVPLIVDLQGARLDDLHLLLSLRDVTERDRLEKEVARAQRLDSLGMLAGGIAHDFNNLLAGMLVAAGELEQEPDLPAELAPRVQSIAESARRGGALTNRLLQFARGRVSPTVGIDLEAELPDMLDMLGRTLGRNIEWSIDVEADLPPVRVDEAELEQILVNLCVNARDAMGPRGGRISVTAWTSEGESEPVVGLRIADDGPGMSAELLARVVEPFVTTKGSGAGTGLGLAVVHGLVASRGGSMLIESQPGEGTRVTLFLPVQEAGPAASPEESVEPAAVQDLRVLLVEDEPSLRTFLSRALERRGIAVQVLSDGEAVMPWIAANEGPQPPVDAVVMDMMMPVVDGMEATGALREVWPGIPVVISSGYTGQESIEPLLETGPTLLLEKPYQVDDLLRALGRVVS